MANLARVAEINRTIAASPTASKGYSAAPSASSGGSSGGGGSSAPTSGAVNTQGQIVDSSGAVLGMANPADRYSPSARPAEPLTTTPGSKYDIQQGDTLSKIANDRGVSLSEIMQSNPTITDPNKINTGQSLTIPTPAQPKPLNPFQIGAAAAKASGAVAPQDQNVARSAIQPYIPPAPTQRTSAQEVIEGDEGYQNLLQTRRDFINAQNQRTSLTEEYQKLTQASGIPQLNTELMNMKNIIEGSEDDIRNEVSKAGGFATDSQVLALTNSRNKQLVKNYNNLLETRNLAQQQVSTIIGLEEKDRAQADSVFDQQFQFDKEIIAYRDKFVDNAKSSYQKIVDKVGYKGLLDMTGGDPYYTGMVEKTLGMGNGTLQRLANIPDEEKILDMSIKRAQLSNLYSQIAERDSSGSVTTDDMGKVVLKPVEAQKISKEIIANDSFKAIRKAQESLQYLNNFENTFKETGATSAVFSPRENSKLKAEYNAAILNLKEFFNLGVLNGPDEAILKGVLSDPTNRSAFLTTVSGGIYSPAASTQSGLDSMKKMINSTIDDRYKSLVSQYGDYSSDSVGPLKDLNRIYIEQKAKVDPTIANMIKDNPDLAPEDIIQIITQ